MCGGQSPLVPFRMISSASWKNDSIRSKAGLSILILRLSIDVAKNRSAWWYASKSEYDSCTCSTVDAQRKRYIKKFPQWTRCVLASIAKISLKSRPDD